MRGDVLLLVVRSLRGAFLRSVRDRVGHPQNRERIEAAEVLRKLYVI